MITAKTKIKAKSFVKDYLESGLNASEAARRNFKSKPEIAPQIGYQYLIKPHTQSVLAEVLDQQDGLNDDVIKSLLKRNAKQNKNLPASNSALDMAIKVKGGYAPEKRASFNLNLTDKQLDDRLNELAEEIKRLKQADSPA